MNTQPTPKNDAPRYATNAPKGYCGDPRRGAALGRPGFDDGADLSKPITLRHIPLNNGGYDAQGTYWGHGTRLYWYASADGKMEGTLRASNRDRSKDAIRSAYPAARFYQ